MINHTHLGEGHCTHIHTPTHTYLHAGVEYLEYVVLERDGGHTVVRENGHHALVQDGEQSRHGLHIRKAFLFLLEPSQRKGQKDFKARHKDI